MGLFPPQVAVTPGFLLAQAFAVVLEVLVVQASLKFRDISDALAFYGVYHRDPINQTIHFFGVPGIIWTAIVFLAHLPMPLLGHYTISFLPFVPRHSVSWGTLAAAFYILFYVKIDPLGGSLYSFVVYAMYVAAVRLMQNDQKLAQKKNDGVAGWTGTGRILRFSFVLHFLSWYVQIHPGHGIFEGAKPAIMDSFGGALSSAPLFAFYELLWLLGINKGLQEETHALVAKYTAELCAAGATMRACTTV